MIKIFSDGGSRGNPGEAASAYIIFDGETEIARGAKYLGKTTNNVAEYNGVILALQWIANNKQIIKYPNLQILYKLDSELVVKQLKGEYKVKDKILLSLVIRIQRIIKDSDLEINFVHVPREQNALADNLVNEKLDISSRR